MTGKINGQTIDFTAGQTLHELLALSGNTLDAPCGGRGVCGKCKIKASGALSKPTAKEKAFLTESELNVGVRLACYCKAEGAFEAFTAGSAYEIETEAEGAKYTVEPDEYVKDFAKKHGEAIGAAIDIGTTTVVAVFYDLISGEKLFTTSGINAQKTYGADVMSRISYAINDKDGDETLKNAIISQINAMISESGIDTGLIARIVIDGNTTMELISAGLSVKSLGALPFEPMSYMGYTASAHSLGLYGENAEVYFMPCCGGFFGGDAVACMLYNNFDLDGNNKYMADIGTNGEMALSANGKLFGCSTAAGPAFEGASIRFGTGSIPGAVNGVSYDENGFVFKTINDKKPCGICGSGLIDLLAVCLDKELIDETGRIDEDCAEFEDAYAVKLTDELYLTQKDVREIQLAKSAICAGTYVLDGMISNGKTPEVFIAGGFGTAINIKSASKIGLLPKKYCEKAVAVGNAALGGAVMALLSGNARERAEKISKNVEIIDLSVSPVFQDEYVENMIFDVEE